MTSVHDPFAIDDFRLASGLQLRPVAAPAEELHAVIAKVLARMQ